MYKFAIFIAYFIWFFIIINAISLIFRQKSFDLIGFIFYDEKYRDISVVDLTTVPYWVSFLLGVFFIVYPIWIYIRDR